MEWLSRLSRLVGDFIGAELQRNERLRRIKVTYSSYPWYCRGVMDMPHVSVGWFEDAMVWYVLNALPNRQGVEVEIRTFHHTVIFRSPQPKVNKPECVREDLNSGVT